MKSRLSTKTRFEEEVYRNRKWPIAERSRLQNLHLVRLREESGMSSFKITLFKN